MAAAGGAVMQGMVKKLFADKGFGFVRGMDGVERFFHRQDCLSPFTDIHEGDPVHFEEGQATDKGPRATSVKVDYSDSYS